MSVILLVFLGAVFLLIAVLCLPVAFAGKVHLAEKVSGEPVQSLQAVFTAFLLSKRPPEHS